jgi:hypothetical protein
MEKKLFHFGGEAIVADAADFGAGDSNLDIAVAGNLLLELFVETGLEFADLAAAEAGDMNVIAGAVGFVVVAVAAEVEKIELVDEALALEEVDGAVDGDEVDVGIDFLGAVEDLVDVEMLLGSVHDLEDDAALAGEADATVAKGVLEMALGSGGVDALTGGNAMCGRGRHGASPSGMSGHE